MKEITVPVEQRFVDLHYLFVRLRAGACPVILSHNFRDKYGTCKNAQECATALGVSVHDIYSSFHNDCGNDSSALEKPVPSIIALFDVFSTSRSALYQAFHLTVFKVNILRSVCRVHLRSLGVHEAELQSLGYGNCSHHSSVRYLPVASVADAIPGQQMGPTTSADSTDTGTSLPKPLSWSLSCSPPYALGEVVACATAACQVPKWGLLMMHEAQTTKLTPAAGDASRPSTRSAAPYLCRRLAQLPLTVLERCIAELQSARDEWHQKVVLPAREAATEALVEVTQQQLNSFAFNICLWQRRHPLEVVATGLELYRENCALFQRGDRPPVQMLHELLEAVTSAMEPELASVHPLLRCDVFMTHPHLPFSEQLALMQSVQTAWTASARTTCPPNISSHPMCPQDLIGSCCAKERIPSSDSRFSVLLSDEQYRQLRDAFENHKQHGVLRLVRCQYTLTQK